MWSLKGNPGSRSKKKKIFFFNMMKNLNRLLDLGKRANRERLKIEDIEDN